jgi:hypothetical protein
LSFTFSICHSTARIRPESPLWWYHSMRDFLKACDRPKDVEYILTVHESNWEEFHRLCRNQWGTGLWWGEFAREWGNFRCIRNTGPNTGVGQGNAGGAAAKGLILIGGMDDLFPEAHWDTAILEAFKPVQLEEGGPTWDSKLMPRVLHVSSGSPGDNRTFIPQIVTKARYDQFGYGGHPSYISMYVDNEFSELAERDGIVIEAPHIVFEHRHPSLGKGQWDEVYAMQNAPENYTADYLTFLARRREGFPKDPAWRRKEPAPAGVSASVISPVMTLEAPRAESVEKTTTRMYTDGRGNYSRYPTLTCDAPVDVPVIVTTKQPDSQTAKPLCKIRWHDGRGCKLELGHGGLCFFGGDKNENRGPLFSILHTSSRPSKWYKVRNDWHQKATRPGNFEYIACFDERWGFSQVDEDFADSKDVDVVWNEHPYKYSGYVTGVNRAAAASSGQILIVVADDQFACEGWDEKLLAELDHAIVPRRTDQEIAAFALSTPFVMEVSTNTVNEHGRGIFVMPILSRARYERLGYVFYPAYESMYADNDLCEQARRDKVVIDARNLIFPHEHPLIPIESGKIEGYSVEGQAYLKETWDKSYQAQHQDDAYRLGASVLEMRRENGFTDLKCSRCGRAWGMPHAGTCTESGNVGKIQPAGAVTPDGRRARTIAWCLPFQQCSAGWFMSAISLYEHMRNTRGFNVIVQVGQSPACHVSREGIRLGVLREEKNLIRAGIIAEGGKVDFLLWEDSDNPLTPQHFDMLLEDLDTHQELTSVAGWYRMTPSPGEPTQTCCAQPRPDGRGDQMILEADLLSAAGLVDISWHGFGGVLMRRSILDLVGDKPFALIPDDSIWGCTGEDSAFLMRAKKAGANIAVDPRVFLPHLKLGEVGPRPVFKPLQSDTAKLSVQTIDGHKLNDSSDKTSPSFQQSATPISGDSQTIDSTTEGKAPKQTPRIIACLRVKNEGRWIKRVLRSISGLCTAALIIDNGSTDNTLAEIDRARAEFLANRVNHSTPEMQVSVFSAHDNDEGNDRQRLLLQAKARGAEFILNLDGDEELEAEGPAKLLQAIESYPGADAYWLQIPYLWNSPETVRVDGWYNETNFARLFRVTGRLSFESIKNGLHTRFNGVQLIHQPYVRLWHYGYMLQADRLAKYEYYNRIDPANEAEDCYRHMVIGDLPELPATARTKKAGPLDVRVIHNGPKWTPQEWTRFVEQGTEARTRPQLEGALL